MGTRHITAVKKDGEYKVVQYGQWDGYPSHSGVHILEFLKTYDKERFLRNLEKCYFISDRQLKQIMNDVLGHNNSWLTMEESEKAKDAYPSLHRDIGCEILDLILNNNDENIPLQNNIGFLEHGYFCKWSYVIDYDTNELKVYDGHIKTGTGTDVETVATYNLETLPSKDDFLKHFGYKEIS